MKKNYIVAIDAGTTSVRVLMYDAQMRVVRKQQQEFTQYYPKPGWVEHDADEIWRVTQRLLNTVLKGKEKTVAAIGITNQRETTVVWDALTGKPIHNAIVWQDRRTTDACVSLQKRGYEKLIQSSTGLVLDPYFSVTKVAWLLDHVRGARKKTAAGTLRFGTIDSWLIWKLTKGKVHATDFTNASRTMLYNIKMKKWDAQLLKILKVPASVLPEVRNSSDDYGMYRGIPITGVVGDQQAALFGQGGVKK